MSIDITFTGHDVEVTEALKKLTTEKMHKLEKHFDHITNISVILSVQKLDQIAEATVNVPGNQLFAKATSQDMYKSIDQLVDKLDTQVKKYKEKMKDHSGQKPGYDLDDNQEAI